MTDRNESYEWPGWSLSDNPYGKEFDLAARKRMVQGSRELLPLLEKYKSTLGDNLLEVGPFFIPLLTREDFPHSEITYWDNDPYAVAWLQGINNVHVEDVDVNTLRPEKSASHFDTAVMSDVLNYVNYKKLLENIYHRLHDGGLVFINNVNEYGLPSHFSMERPTSIEEIRHNIINSGFTILEEHVIPSPNQEHQREPRLLVVAQK